MSHHRASEFQITIHRICYKLQTCFTVCVSSAKKKELVSRNFSPPIGSSINWFSFVRQWHPVDQNKKWNWWMQSKRLKLRRGGACMMQDKNVWLSSSNMNEWRPILFVVGLLLTGIQEEEGGGGGQRGQSHQRMLLVPVARSKAWQNEGVGMSSPTKSPCICCTAPWQNPP